MKHCLRNAAAVILAGAVLCGAAGCSSGKGRPVNKYPDGSLVGEWTNYTYDTILGEDGSVSVEADASGLIYYMSDGVLMADGYEIPAANTRYNNGDLTVTGDITGEGDEVLLELRRIGETYSDRREIFDGVYEIAGGSLKQRLIDEYAGGMDEGVSLVIDRGNCELRMSGVGTYKQKGDELTISGDLLTQAGYTPERTNGLYFVLENDCAVLHFADGSVESFKKVG